MTRRCLITAALLCGAAALRPAPAAAQTDAGDVPAANGTNGDGRIAACYVRRAGTIYLIGETDTPEMCTRSDHVAFEWNEQWDVPEFQRRVAATCEAGSSIRAIHEDGTVECEPDDDTAAGHDYSTRQLRIQPCGEGSTIRAVHADGSVECEIDDVADTEGLQGRVVEACPEGSTMTAVAADGTVSCRPDRGATSSLALDNVFGFASDPASNHEDDLGSTTDRVCFLTNVMLGELDSRGEIGECRIVASRGRWLLRARETGNDSEATCRARCLSWSN